MSRRAELSWADCQTPIQSVSQVHAPVSEDQVRERVAVRQQQDAVGCSTPVRSLLEECRGHLASAICHSSFLSQQDVLGSEM